MALLGFERRLVKRRGLAHPGVVNEHVDGAQLTEHARDGGLIGDIAHLGLGLRRREGSKRTGHLAVRDLIAQARHAVQALKPCFLMSPLAVSRLLPPEIEFDVVIIDEASQVTTADAINCVYRGDALIIAGDERQLPPTSFYDHVEDDVADYPSILDLSRETFPVLGLW